MEATRQLISETDLSFGKTGFLARLVARVLMRLTRMPEINRLYDQTYSYTGPYAEGLLKNLNISYTAQPPAMQSIPTHGPTIVIANHPTGALEGILLIDMLSKIRPDVKFMGNYILSKIEPLRHFFINVDPVHHDSPFNFKGIRAALQHVSEGGMLMVFPAGAVSTCRNEAGQWIDKPWEPSILRFIRQLRAPVVPIFIDAENSPLFYRLGVSHPLVRTALLPRELLNKKHRHVDLHIGEVISSVRQAQFENLTEYSKFLRESVEDLRSPLLNWQLDFQ